MVTDEKDYSASASFSPSSQQILTDLQQYGFIYKPTPTSDQFYPTHLCTSLCSGDTATTSTSAGEEKRFLILETNYKIYAYSSNELEIAILNLFVDIRIRYQNLVVGKLDRQHVKAAMGKGISAGQIISYLSSHAHPQMYLSVSRSVIRNILLGRLGVLSRSRLESCFESSPFLCRCSPRTFS